MDCATLSVLEAARLVGIGRVRMCGGVRVGRVWGVRGNVAFVLAREGLPSTGPRPAPTFSRRRGGGGRRRG